MTASIAPHKFDGLLDQYPTVGCLSLDCFDTLLWRDTHAPRDIFHGLPDTTIIQRSSAESHARRAAIARGRGNEITIEEIYAQLMPNGSMAERKRAIDAEIDAEARHCFAFAPTVKLMQAAKARGLKVVIVSDTYLSADQLLGLIAQSAGEDVAALIDQVFCSCKFGKSKAGGLYQDVLRKLKIEPGAILHIGDNRGADVDGVARFGVHTAHLQQFSASSVRRLRLEAAVDGIAHATTPNAVSCPLPHRAALSLAEPLALSPAEQLGMSVLGPVLCGFERWLSAEAQALQAARGGKVRWLFLMRDGYLPMQVHALHGPHDTVHAVEISRFTAIAASLTSDKAIHDHIEREFGTDAEVVARQLLFPEDSVASLCDGLTPEEACKAVLREARTGQRKKATIRAARGMADRLVAHIQKTVSPSRGDTLMLVDLGYNCTVQNRIDDLLKEKLGVHVAGRCLLLRETNRSGLDKKGFISSDHYDAFMLEALCANVAVLEQLCTRSAGSVCDYEADGTPIRRENDIKQTQSETRDEVQQGCLKFQAFEDGVVIRRTREADEQNWRKGAVSVLARMMFLPMPEELGVIEQFEHDVNLGTARTTSLFDKSHAHRALRQRGLFYMNASERMYLPAELQGQGMATRLSLLTQRRFGLPLTFGDMADATIDLPVIIADREQAVPQLISAMSTHDGYFLAAVPVGASRYSVALQFGALFDWFEIESLSFHKVDEFLSAIPEERHLEFAAEPTLDGIERVGGRLMRCDNDAGFIMVHPPQQDGNDNLMLACVFRPTVVREAQRVDQAAAKRPATPTQKELHA